jgi:hypothetical protein
MSRPDEPEEAGGGFLGRWARRKQEAQRQAAAPSRPTAPESAEPTVAEQPPVAELPLPTLDDIVPDADVTAFFQKHVPEALRTAALRKLWVTDPAIKDFIEMADYQWDFNNPDTIPGWSASIGDVDVNRLANRILGLEADDRDSAGAVPRIDVDAASGARDAEKDLGENPQDSEITAESDPAQLAAHAAEKIDVAAQNTLDDSVVYIPARKRHGGALPT